MGKLAASCEKLLKSGRARTALTAAVVAVMFAVLLAVNLLTPLLADDYIYSRGLVFGEDTPVQSLSDAFRSAANMYKMHSGRTFTCFGYLLYSLLGRVPVAVINSAAYMLTAWLLSLLICGEKKNSLFLFVGVNLSLWVFSPELGQDIFWVCGTVNYLLPMLPILGMMLIYRRYNGAGKSGAGKCVLMALLGLVAGWQLENSSVAVPFVALAYICLWRYKGVKTPKWAWAGFAGSAVGFVLLVAAPGNFRRYAHESQALSLSLPFKFAMITYYWIMFAGVLTALFVLGAIKCRKSRPDAVRQGAIFAAAALGTAYCMIVSPSSPERAWFITVALMTVAAGIVLEAAFPLKTISFPAKAVLCTAALILLGTMAADTMLASYDIHGQFVRREEIITAAKQNGETVVSVPVYELKYPLKAERYALYGLYDIELGENSPNSFNAAAAQYYGVDAIIGISGQ